MADGVLNTQTCRCNCFLGLSITNPRHRDFVWLLSLALNQGESGRRQTDDLLRFAPSASSIRSIFAEHAL